MARNPDQRNVVVVVRALAWVLEKKRRCRRHRKRERPELNCQWEGPGSKACG